MTYVDDDDFDELEANDEMDDDLEADESGHRCDECGLKIKKDDATVCPACATTYHRWCVTECNRCNTPLNTGEADERKPGKAGVKRAAPKRKAAVKATSTVRAPRAR